MAQGTSPGRAQKGAAQRMVTKSFRHDEPDRHGNGYLKFELQDRAVTATFIGPQGGPGVRLWLSAASARELGVWLIAAAEETDATAEEEAIAGHALIVAALKEKKE